MRFCGASSPDQRLSCTNEMRHRGPHEARGAEGGPVYESWPSDAQLIEENTELRERAERAEARIIEAERIIARLEVQEDVPSAELSDFLAVSVSLGPTEEPCETCHGTGLVDGWPLPGQGDVITTPMTAETVNVPPRVQHRCPDCAAGPTEEDA